MIMSVTAIKARQIKTTCGVVVVVVVQMVMVMMMIVINAWLIKTTCSVTQT